MNNVGFDASDFLNRIGVEDKLNAFLDSEPVKGVILAEYEAVKADVTAALSRLPEKYRGKATDVVNEKLEKMDGEVFVEIVLGKLSEDVAYGLSTLEKYLDITAVTQQLMDAVDEKVGLQNTLHEMASELSYALKRNLKTAMVKVVSDDVESEDEFKQMIKVIFEGDEDAPAVITVEGLEEVADALASFITDCLFSGYDGESEEDDECDCCGACDGECGCTEGACCREKNACAECENCGKDCERNCNCEEGE